MVMSIEQMVQPTILTPMPRNQNACIVGGCATGGIPLGWCVDAVGDVKGLHCATSLFYCNVLTKHHMGVVVMVGTPCGVWAMGAMWMTQIMLVSGNDHPKLASGQKGITWSPMGCVLWVMGGLPNSLQQCGYQLSLGSGPNCQQAGAKWGWLLCQQWPRQ